MSSFNQKVTVVTEILQDNARQLRLTNRQELERESGRRLYLRGQKKNDGELDRYKVVEVLERIARNTTDGVLLPAIVVHYSDSRPGRRFSEWAQLAGVSANHGDAVRRVFDVYGDSYAKSLFNPSAKHAADADEDYDEDDYDDIADDDRDEGD